MKPNGRNGNLKMQNLEAGQDILAKVYQKMHCTNSSSGQNMSLKLAGEQKKEGYVRVFVNPQDGFLLSARKLLGSYGGA